MKSQVVLFGGSFNPPHMGHFEMASYLCRTLPTCLVWMLFSQNPDKDPLVYPDLSHRMAMARLLAPDYDPRIILSDAEAKIAARLGRNDTYYILQELEKEYSDTQFIWAMGADSFAGFHGWPERDDILARWPVIILSRAGYTDAALESPSAQDCASLRFDPKDIGSVRAGWCFLEAPPVEISSTDIMRRLKQGQRDFQPPFSRVADYIYTHHLYGT